MSGVVAGTAGVALLGAGLVALALRLADHGAAALAVRLVDGMMRAGRVALVMVWRGRAALLRRAASVALLGPVACGALALVWTVCGDPVPLPALARWALGCSAAAAVFLAVLVGTVPPVAARLPDRAIGPAVVAWWGAMVATGLLVGLARHQGGAS